MKKFIFTISLLSTMLISSTSIFAYNYNFGESYALDAFGKATTSEIASDNSSIQNIRRDKNSTLSPPSYGVFSGEFDTSPTNPYFTPTNLASTTEINSNFGYTAETSDFLVPTSTISTTYTPSTPSINLSYSDNYTRITSVDKYSDGSIGTLRIDKIKVNKRIYETVDLNILAKGIGHFSETSMWDGNVALASHNRGSGAYFSEIDKLRSGDIIEYTTKIGTRKYKVYSVEKISETDTSDLLDTHDNTITLITCVRNDKDYRWCVRASEIN